MWKIQPENIGRAAAKYFLNEELTLVWKSAWNLITQQKDYLSDSVHISAGVLIFFDEI